ncbi:MAG: aldehyde dehydrogenase family protein [Bacteroidetes bacterium]|nr:aldehyde dehydrogenase family protein [Bacteroidota bacterium]
MMQLSDFRPSPAELFASQLPTSIAWRTSTLVERKERLLKLLNWINSHQEAIREALWMDFSKPAPEVDLNEIFPITSEIKYCLKNLSAWMRPQPQPTPLPMLGTSAFVVAEPKGRALLITPWNFPFNLVIGPLVSALAAGCTAILKPSEYAPHTAQLVQDLVSDLFAPHEVAVCLGEKEVASELLGLPFDHIYFTGSPAIGKIVMRAAAQHLSSVTLELGGKSPVILDASADLKDAAEKLIWGKFINCGQTCLAPDYILVPEDKKEIFIGHAREVLIRYYDPNGKGIMQSPDYARLINAKHFDRIRQLLEDSLQKGALVEAGGELDEETRYVAPTLISNIREDMLVFQEEIFGPILPILTYSHLNDALALIHSQPKPLALYFFGKDEGRAKRVMAETSSGNLVINDCVLHFLHSELPFGGVNNSGIGKAHGKYGFLAFSNEKGVLKQRIGFNNISLLRPPYGLRVKKLIATLMKWF